MGGIIARQAMVVVRQNNKGKKLWEERAWSIDNDGRWEMRNEAAEREDLQARCGMATQATLRRGAR